MRLVGALVASAAFSPRAPAISGSALSFFGAKTHINGMNYLLAILLPPVSILLTGRPIIAILVFLIWIPALLFSGGLTHPMFIILAWLLIFQAREDRRDRRALHRDD